MDGSAGWVAQLGFVIGGAEASVRQAGLAQVAWLGIGHQRDLASIWATSFEFPITRIDPATNTVVQQFFGPGGDAIRAGRGSVWLSNLRQGNVWRLDPKRIEATVQ